MKRVVEAGSRKCRYRSGNNWRRPLIDLNRRANHSYVSRMMLIMFPTQLLDVTRMVWIRRFII